MAVKHYRTIDARSGEGIEVTLGPENEMRVDVDGVCLFHAKGNVPEKVTQTVPPPRANLTFPSLTKSRRQVWVLQANDVVRAVVTGSRQFAESVAAVLAHAEYEEKPSFQTFEDYWQQSQWHLVGLGAMYEEKTL